MNDFGAILVYQVLHKCRSNSMFSFLILSPDGKVVYLVYGMFNALPNCRFKNEGGVYAESRSFDFGYPDPIAINY